MNDKKNYNVLYEHGRPFLCVINYKKPARGVKTERKGWSTEMRNWDITELPYIVDHVTYKFMCKSSVIIDLLENSVVKHSHSDDSSNADMLKYYRSKYSAEIAQALDVWNIKNRMVAA